MYVPSTRNIISSYGVGFDEIFSSALAYTSRSYSEAMAMRLSVTYTLYATPSKEQTGNIITFTQFEEGNLVSEDRNDAETGDEFDDDLIMTPLLSREEIYAMDSVGESDDEPMSTDMLEYILDVSQYYTNINRIEARNKIIYSI